MNNEDMQNRAYPKSFHPDALWNKDEIKGYLSVSTYTFYEIEPFLHTFKIGRRRVAFAKDIIDYAKSIQQEQNPV